MLRRMLALRCSAPKPPPGAAAAAASGGVDPSKIKHPEHITDRGAFEVFPPDLKNRGAVDYMKYKREPPGDGERLRDIMPGTPYKDHHPEFDYTNRSGHKEGYAMGGTAEWEPRLATRTLYRAALRSLPLIKHYYLLNLPMDRMKMRVRQKFEQNRFVKDPDAVRSLLMIGWQEYHDSIGFRKQKGHMMKLFGDREDGSHLLEHYTQEEGKLIDERETFSGGKEQRRNGPYDGFWSRNSREYDRYTRLMNGRVRRGTTTAKDYFYPFQPDGTNPWEKNMDYEGWWLKNMDPDKDSARKELAGWISQAYVMPKHYTAKNRRAYRRMVKDVKDMMTRPFQEVYARSRESIFQLFIREDCPEANRINAEKRLAIMDDDMFTTKHDEFEPLLRRAMREFPNPKAWKTDSFYLRVRQLCAPLEYNWAKAPIGMAQERAFNEWISNDVNYAVWNSDVFAAVRGSRKHNPMAATWSQFYTDFDPDVPSTRRLPWYHPEFNYDRRHKWDERCYRMKKWVRTGDVDFVRPFFQSLVNEWEQQINRVETLRQPNAVEKRYVAPRYVQLYRSLQKRMDIALANQMRVFAGLKGTEKEADALKKLKATNWDSFVFDVPPVIYPDGWRQPLLSLDGTPMPGQPPAGPKDGSANNDSDDTTTTTTTASTNTAPSDDAAEMKEATA
eukprot:PhM_4_TR18888/c2_g1_i2/m.76655